MGEGVKERRREGTYIRRRERRQESSKEGAKEHYRVRTYLRNNLSPLEDNFSFFETALFEVLIRETHR